mmetsp:Transcript_74167/g.138538  ORF Transcript_74167/g.138538 Transcript_74167/m.138538 type:complete len:230 (-) Transcript_74167:1320-2009(-)
MLCIMPPWVLVVLLVCPSEDVTGWSPQPFLPSAAPASCNGPGTVEDVDVATVVPLADVLSVASSVALSDADEFTSSPPPLPSVVFGSALVVELSEVFVVVFVVAFSELRPTSALFVSPFSVSSPVSLQLCAMLGMHGTHRKHVTGHWLLISAPTSLLLHICFTSRHWAWCPSISILVGVRSAQPGLDCKALPWSKRSDKAAFLLAGTTASSQPYMWPNCLTSSSEKPNR